MNIYPSDKCTRAVLCSNKDGLKRQAVSGEKMSSVEARKGKRRRNAARVHVDLVVLHTGWG